ncbi:hypothetical protein BH20CHL2_BH20CHL2_05770 [soil metagenome]
MSSLSIAIGAIQPASHTFVVAMTTRFDFEFLDLVNGGGAIAHTHESVLPDGDVNKAAPHV